MIENELKLSTDQRPYIMVYHDFLESELLDNPYQITLYICLKKFANKDNQCFPSLRKLTKISKMSKRKVQETLKELEEKRVINIENRVAINGGKHSNLYTLCDFKELWNAGSSEDVEAVNDEIEERRMIEALTAKGYYISKEPEKAKREKKDKEKGLVSDSSQTVDTSTDKNYTVSKEQNTIDKAKSQAERYTMQDIKALFEYDSLIIQHPAKQTDIDIVFDILHETLNSTKKTIRIGGEDKPQMVVAGKLMKLQPGDLIYSIDKYHEQTDRIKNVKAYLLTVLYNSREQNYLDLMNLGHHNFDF